MLHASYSETEVQQSLHSKIYLYLCCCAGNVYGVVSKFHYNGWLKASIVLMLAHQCIAYALYFLPLAFMAEKLCHVHTKPMALRVCARIPVCRLPIPLNF